MILRADRDADIANGYQTVTIQKTQFGASLGGVVGVLSYALMHSPRCRSGCVGLPGATKIGELKCHLYSKSFL